MPGQNRTLGRSSFRRSQSDYRRDRYKKAPSERHSQGYRLCVYCGQPADTLDHCPPLSRIDDYESLGLRRELYLTVPSCRHCNALAADSLQDNIFERIDYVKDRLSNKLKKYLKKIEWDDEEIEELGPSLASAVLANNKKTELAISRVEYYGGFDVVMDWIEEDESHG
jgi:5-methylcytosine-specific restriction endonuclease McrA